MPSSVFPTDPSFTQITSFDLDGNLRDETFTDLPAPGLVLYLVTNRGLSGNVGPAGHYP